MWARKSTGAKRLGAPSHGSEVVFEKIQALEPKDENQRTLKAQALGTLELIWQTRWLQFERKATACPCLYSQY
jgi:hypothetical protein